MPRRISDDSLECCPRKLRDQRWSLIGVVRGFALVGALVLSTSIARAQKRSDASTATDVNAVLDSFAKTDTVWKRMERDRALLSSATSFRCSFDSGKAGLFGAVVHGRPQVRLPVHWEGMPALGGGRGPEVAFDRVDRADRRARAIYESGVADVTVIAGYDYLSLIEVDNAGTTLYTIFSTQTPQDYSGSYWDIELTAAASNHWVGSVPTTQTYPGKCHILEVAP